MTYAHIANGIRAGESFLCLLVQHRGAGIKRWPWVLSGDEIVSSLGSSSRSHPGTVPRHLLPYYQGNKQSIQKSLLPASPSYLPWHAPMKPFQAKSGNTGCLGALSLTAPSAATPNALSAQWHTAPPPQFILGSGGNLGNTDFNRRVWNR